MIFIVTGAAGFTGANLTEYLSEQGHEIYAVVRPGSEHNKRLCGLRNVTQVELDMSDLAELKNIVSAADVFIHLTWSAGRFDIEGSNRDADVAVNAVRVAADIGCKRIVITGSQAEYGATETIQTEDLKTNPFCEYGKAKVRACLESRKLAKELGIEWVWGRIFSLIGKYEPEERLFPHMIKALKVGEPLNLSSCRQYWDYLDEADAVRALEALALRGKDGEIYNIAYGDYRPLKDFVQDAKSILDSESELIFGDDPEPFVSLQPCVEKIYRDTGWKAEVPYNKSVLKQKLKQEQKFDFS